jgi:2-methylcitrate dehydratase PrpD
VILPAVFAVAQERRSGSDQILLAAAIGMEVSCRIAAAGHPATRRNHFHNTPLAGVFGAAAAVSVLLGLDSRGVANALGIAGSHASGLFEFLGQSADIKRLHPGKAARDGITSADLAQAGLTGPTTVLEGKEGYFAAFAGEPGVDWFPETVRDGLGEQWVLLNTYVKPYPCCRHLHGAIDGVIALKEENTIDPLRVESITVGTFLIATRHAGTTIDTRLDAQLSIPFTLAVALVRGSISLADFDEESRTDEVLLSVMNKVTVHLDAAADYAYPLRGRPAEVTIRLVDGTEFHRRVEYPYGEPANAMSDADLEVKARTLLEPVIGEGNSTALIAAAWNFTNLEFLDELDDTVRAARSVLVS